MQLDGTNMIMIRGDSEDLTINLSGVELTESDFVEMTVKRRASDEIASLYKKMYLIDGSATIKIEPSDTDQLDFGQYIYDIQLTYGNTVKTVVGPSLFILAEEVTYDADQRDLPE